jgi:hypothetical protein
MDEVEVEVALDERRVSPPGPSGPSPSETRGRAHNQCMSRRWSFIVVVSALVTLFAGLGVVATGQAYGWLLVATGLVNTALGVVTYRKAVRQEPELQ